MLNCAYYYYRNFMTQFSKWLSDLFQFWLSFSFLPTLPNHKFPPPLHLKVSFSQLMIFPYSALGMQAHPGRLLLLFHDPRPAVTPPPDFLGWMVFLCAHPCNPQQGKECFWSPLEWNPDPSAWFPPASFLSFCVACSPGSTHISTSKSLVLVLGPLCWVFRLGMLSAQIFLRVPLSHHSGSSSNINIISLERSSLTVLSKVEPSPLPLLSIFFDTLLLCSYNVSLLYICFTCCPWEVIW